MVFPAAVSDIRYYQAVALLAGLAVLALCMALLPGRRRPARAGKPAAEPPADLGHSRPWAERRRFRRSPSVGVRVQVLGLDGPAEYRGVVRDRSPGGLGLRVPRAAAVGAALRVRACDAPTETPWAVLRVRWCRRQGAYYELGGDFAEPPGLDVLLTFG